MIFTIVAFVAGAVLGALHQSYVLPVWKRILGFGKKIEAKL